MEISNLSIYLSQLVTSSTRHHGLYHGVHCHPPLLTQARTESDISGKGNGGVGGNNDEGNGGKTEMYAAETVPNVCTPVCSHRGAAGLGHELWHDHSYSCHSHLWT